MKYVIPGDPVYQIRHKRCTVNGKTWDYDPRAKEKKAIRLHMQSKKLPKLFEHPRISFIFHMPINKSTTKKSFLEQATGYIKHEKKPDIDNLIKLYLDCLDGIAFEGDQKVSLGPAIKLYHPSPKTIIIINETTRVISPLEVDPLTWYALFGKECGKCSYDEMDSLHGSYTPDRLEASLYDDNSFLRQRTDTFEEAPFVPLHLLKEFLALKQLSDPSF